MTPVAILVSLACSSCAVHPGAPSAPAEMMAPAPDFDGMGAMAGMDHGAMHGGAHGHEMNGRLGPVPMSREASGTSWQPEATPLEGWRKMSGPWMLMAGAFANLGLDAQGGPRGRKGAFTTSMAMFMAQRRLGPGTIAFDAMGSADPVMGRHGYPLLLQTGEGRLDDQHDHNGEMELSASYSLPVGRRGSVFVYGGDPAEPALGPPAFMHRAAGEDIPVAPIGHHSEDSTHYVYGDVTAGAIWRGLKAEYSRFNAVEPSDDNRWAIGAARALRSCAFRLSYNPTKAWALQVSRGLLVGPEKDAPNVNVVRTTASALHSGSLAGRRWESALVWGRNDKEGRHYDAFLAESSLRLGRFTAIGRAERVKKDELFPADDPRFGNAYQVGRVDGGAVYDFARSHGVSYGLGGMVGTVSVGRELRPVYGQRPVDVLVWLRIKLSGDR